jgi:hypothetical protein
MENHHAIKFGKPSISMGHRKTMAMLVITRGYLQLITLEGIVRILATTTNAVRDCAPLATRHGTSRQSIP